MEQFSFHCPFFNGLEVFLFVLKIVYTHSRITVTHVYFICFNLRYTYMYGVMNQLPVTLLPVFRKFTI
jgi:hypothetical protein